MRLEEGVAVGDDRLADFYIIGAMKCATSTLHEQLARRSIFFMTDPKEPNFFNNQSLYSTNLNWYQGLFRGARPEQICGESSTHYTKLPTYQGTAFRIFEKTPQAKLVYVIRHPVERLVSHYIHEWTEGNTTADISTAVFEDEQFIAYSCYARQLQPFLDLFDRRQILVVFFEHLTVNRERELERIARFLGDPGHEPFIWSEEVNQTNASRERMRKSALRDAVLSLEVGRALKDMLPDRMKQRIKSHWQMQQRPTLDARTEVHVSRILSQDLKELSSLLGLELSIENFKTLATKTRPEWA